MHAASRTCLDEIYCFHGRLQEVTFERWGDKTPYNVGWMEQILRVFPRAKFVHLLRDGVDVVHSYSRRRDYSGDLSQPARRWKGAVALAHSFAAAHPARVLEVRYEHLVQHPEATVQHICGFLDLSYHPSMLDRTDHYGEMREAQSVSHYENAFTSISTDSIGKGRRNLNDKQKRQVAALIGDDLARLGYEPLE